MPLIRLASYLLVLAGLLPLDLIAQNPQQTESDSGDPGNHIAIGLLLPDQSHSAAIKAAEFAIDRANASGGYNNKAFKLVVRSAEGFWGAGSKESVSLVYEDQVCAIVGALDGRNGHLAEQVATKSHLCYIETFATEPTLSQAFVPWFMRVVPNDNQQSLTIIEQIQRNGGGKIGILSTGDYDTRYAVKSLTRAVAGETNSPPELIELEAPDIQLDDLINMIQNKHLNHLVIPFDAPILRDLVVSLRAASPALNIYGTLHFTMGIEKQDYPWTDYEGVYMIRPHVDHTGYPQLPSSGPVYIYDAITLLIHAIRQVGTDRVDITNYISSSRYSSALTGEISFDELGNRQEASTLIRIQKGVPQIIHHP